MEEKTRNRDLLSVTIAKKINDMIIQGNMTPGTKLPSETQFIEWFRVSKSTIREALKTLNAQNIVVIRQGDGTYVSDNTGRGEDPLGLRFIEKETLIEGIFEARLMLEPQIAMLAAERATTEEIRELGKIVAEMQKIDYMNEARIDLEIRFHTLIAKSCKNAVFNQLIPVIYETLEKGIILLHESEESHKRAQHEHEEIYKAIVRRETWKVQAAVASHIYNSLEDIKRVGIRKELK